MVIAWKWRPPAIEENLLEKKWRVDGSNTDLLYCLSQDKWSADHIGEKLKRLINDDPSAQIQLFLHRQAYRKESLDYIFNLLNTLPEQKPVFQIKGFLFGQDRDFIYIKTQKAGLLGTNGRLGGTVSVDNEEREFQVIKEDGIIYPTQFNKVWDYYAHEFKQKIFDVFEMLMIRLFPAYESDTEMDAVELYQMIKKDELLVLRLRSLQNIKLEEEKLIEIEKKEGRSYGFEDCRSNLKTLYGEGAAELYDELIQTLDSIMAPETEKVNPRERLTAVRKSFVKLLESMPEATFY